MDLVKENPVYVNTFMHKCSSPVPWGPQTPAKNTGLTGSSWDNIRFLRTACGNQIQVQSNRFLRKGLELSGTF